VHPKNPKRLYAGASPIHVYRSDDGGDNWKKLADPGLPDRVIMAFACRVMRLDVDPNSPDDVYATLEANGAMRSRNAGESWEDCTADLIRFCEEPKYRSRIGSQTEIEGMLDGHALACSAAAPGTVFLANRMGLFRSNDKGAHWEDMEIGRFSPLTYGRDVRTSPLDPKVLYAALSPAARSTDGSVYRSDDVGKTWTRFDRSIKADATMMGVIPHPTISSSSRRFWPCGVTPESVPIATFTPAAIARLMLSRWTSMTILVLSIAYCGTFTPRSAASSTPRGAISVGTR